MRGSPKSGRRRSPGGPPTPPWKVSDQLWSHLAPLLADPPRRACNAGRKRLSTRACLEGILYLLYTGCRYLDVPRELGFPSGETCRRRLHEWIDKGVWEQAMEQLVSELNGAGKLDWGRVVIDASLIDARKGATRPALAR